MRKLHFLALSLAFCFAAHALADDASDFYTKNDKGETVWALTDYLKGTTSEVRALLNKDVDRLNDSIAETNHDIEQLEKDMGPGQTRAVAAVRATAKYIELAAEMKQADADRKTSQGLDKLDASSRFNKARLALAKMERDAVMQDPVLADDQKELTADKQQLVAHKAALQKATQWRGQLLSAIRGTFRLAAPLRIGSKGLVPDLMVTSVSDEGVTGQFDAEVPGSETNAKVAEGIQTSAIEAERVSLTLLGSYPAKVGHIMRLNQSFEVIRVKDDPKLGQIYVMKPVNTEVDALLQGMPTDDAAPTTRPAR